MTSGATAQEQRRKTNPVFNDRKFKLGTFGTNLDRGCAISTIDGVLQINGPNTLELATSSGRFAITHRIMVDGSHNASAGNMTIKISLARSAYTNGSTPR